jgi:hypothetical protein
MKKNESRRTAIKKMVAGLGGIPLITSLSGFNTSEEGKPIPIKPYGNKDIDNPITAITLGAGSRGNVYGNYGVAFPNELNIIGVAEPIEIRNERYTEKHNIPEQNCITAPV